MAKERIKARYYDRKGREVGVDYYNDDGPHPDRAELLLRDAIGLFDAIAATWPEGYASKASADLKSTICDVRSGALDPDEAERLAKRMILQAARGYTAAGIRTVAYDSAKLEHQPDYRTDTAIFEQARKFRDYIRAGKERNEAYRLATGGDVKRVDKRFKDACIALGFSFPEKPRGPRKGSKQTKPREYKTHGVDPVDCGGRKSRS